MILHSPESEYAKEALKWEAQHSVYGPPGRPFQYQEYPKWVHKAGRGKTGPPLIVDSICVDNDQQEKNMLSRGYRVDQNDAIALLEKAEFEVAELAANRAYHEQRMSAKAREEAAAADAATSAHVPSIPETPIKRRYVKKTKKEAPHAV